jgi:ankyrin repeat protein
VIAEIRPAPSAPFGRRQLLSAASLWLIVPGVHAGAKEDFFKAIELDRPGLLQPLLDSGFDPNTPDERGQLGLILALRDGCFEVAALLLDSQRLEIDRPNASGETALMMAALRGQAVWVQRLISRGAAINRAGWTPLHYAASGPEPQVVALLLERGARLEALSANGTTALMMAAGYGAIDSADLLLAKGADAKRRNERGLNAADFARRAGRDELAGRLTSPVR